MFSDVGSQVEVFCAGCRTSMGLVSRGEIEACLWEDGQWAEKCFDCSGKGAEYPAIVYECVENVDFLVIDGLEFYFDYQFRTIPRMSPHTHDMCDSARGLSSSTYLNKSGGDKPKGFVEQSGKRWIETEKTMCKRCNGRGLVFPIDEPMAGCSLCEGSGVLYRDIEYPVFLDIPEWVLQPKFQLSGVRLEDEHLFADWLVDDDDDEKDGGYAAYQDFKRDRFGVGDNE